MQNDYENQAFHPSSCGGNLSQLNRPKLLASSQASCLGSIRRFRIVCLILSAVFLSVLATSVADHMVWSKQGFKASSFNGSSLRTLREVARWANRRDDSWTPMRKAIGVWKGPQGDRIYEELFHGQKIKFQYAPTSLVYLYGLKNIGASSDDALNIINVVLFSAGAIALVYTALLLATSHSGLREPWYRHALLAFLTVIALVTYYPSVKALELGQIQVWINSLFVFACVAWLRGAKVTAGCLLALAATIKPQFGIFLLWALIWREWRFLWGFLGAGIAVGCISLLLFGLHNHIAYLDVLSYLSRHGESFYANQSVNGLLHRAFGNGNNLTFDFDSFPPADIRVIAGTLVASVVLFVIALSPGLRATRRPSIVDFSIAALCATLASPIVWEHHFGIMLPQLVIALWGLMAVNSGRVPLAILTMSWILSTNYLPATNLASGSLFNFIQSYLLIAALLLLGILIYLRRQQWEHADGAPRIRVTNQVGQ